MKNSVIKKFRVLSTMETEQLQLYPTKEEK